MEEKSDKSSKHHLTLSKPLYHECELAIESCAHNSFA